MNHGKRAGAVIAAVGLVIAGCAAMRDGGTPAEDPAAKAIEVMKASFKPHGQAGLDRIDQDATQRLCTQYHVGVAMPAEVAERIEREQQATIKYPADGEYLGDWKRGEKVAQSGRGMQYSDDPKKPNGGNCYACHQLTAKEVSYGTIGPSLLGFGKTRGFTPQMAKYAYGKVYNSEAFAACSSMPRFGYHGILTEQQIKDVVALLMDPGSPVNQ
jgi:sulfur-oxidizing protein SoxX